MAIVQPRCEASGSATGEARKEKIETSYTVADCRGNYPTVRSELMFLLHKNPDTSLRDDPELAPVGRFF